VRVAARVASGLSVERAGVGCCLGKAGRGVTRRAGSSARTAGGRASTVGHLGAAWRLGAVACRGRVAPGLACRGERWTRGGRKGRGGSVGILAAALAMTAE
jgi:hypothetical protein